MRKLIDAERHQISILIRSFTILLVSINSRYFVFTALCLYLFITYILWTNFIELKVHI